MNKKKTWIVGIVCMLIPILLITIVFIFVFQTDYNINDDKSHAFSITLHVFPVQ